MLLLMASASSVIVWFRNDLRLSDHAALAAAAGTGAPLICLFILDEAAAQSARRPLGAAAKWWLANSLRTLDRELRKRGQRLILRRGDTATILVQIAQEAKAKAVFWLDSEIPAEAACARQVITALHEIGVETHISRSDLLASPSAIRNKEGHGLRVFTRFWKRVRALGDPPHPLPAMKKLPPSVASVESESIEDWQLKPLHPDWASGLRARWTPGEAGARKKLDAFLDDAVDGYASRRDDLARDQTSHLSAHLRFGEISPRQVFHATRFTAERNPALSRDVEKFLSELGWREFCRHLLFDQPDLHRQDLQHSFDNFPWRTDHAALRAWQQGRTGYPIVDAGMRELWHTGTMHNRVRMVAASFLVKHLLIDWREGERWFWDTLVDADPGSNPGNWQWVAGCGADAAPYFRIFNPVLQGEKFDPDGVYVMKWVPELAKLPPKLIHQPWEATPMELAAAGITLGKTYPAPIVDHKAARERALTAYRKTRS